MIPFAGRKKAQKLEYQQLIETEIGTLEDALFSKKFHRSNLELFSYQYHDVTLAKCTDTDCVSCKIHENGSRTKSVTEEQSKHKHKCNVLKGIFTATKEKQNGQSEINAKHSSRISTKPNGKRSLNSEWQHSKRRDLRSSAFCDFENVSIKHCKCEGHVMISTLADNLRFAGLL